MSFGNELGVSLPTLGLIAVGAMSLYVVAMIWGTIKKPNGNAIMALVMSLMFVWFGWMLADWPTRKSGDGMLLVILKAWRDTIITLVWALFKLFGASDAWDKTFGQFLS